LLLRDAAPVVSVRMIECTHDCKQSLQAQAANAGVEFRSTKRLQTQPGLQQG
jgi:hypothetical protein